MHVIKSRFFDVTVDQALANLDGRYYIVQAATAEEAAALAGKFGEVVNVSAKGTMSVLLKGDE